MNRRGLLASLLAAITSLLSAVCLCKKKPKRVYIGALGFDPATNVSLWAEQRHSRFRQHLRFRIDVDVEPALRKLRGLKRACAEAKL